MVQMTVTQAESHMPPEDSGGSPVPLLPQLDSRHVAPVIHPSADAPLCPSCRQLDLPFFDPSCPGCLEILHGPQTSVGQVFAILRQWVPQTQRNVELLVTEILKRGAHINDRDGLTDMTLLHYACKAGACGVGDIAAATRTVAALLDSGADPALRCRWTDMAAAHYAAYFDVPSVLELLHRATGGTEVDSPCRDFENGSPLHIAATNLCTEAAKFLVEHGASTGLRDDLGRVPLECVPDPGRASPDLREAIQAMRDLLSRHTAPASPVTGKAVLGAMGLHLGDRVRVAGVKVGILRYLGAAQFASGIWAGVELEEPLGKNDGSINGVQYFTCPPNHGIFAPFSKISKFDGSPIKSPSKPTVPRHVSYPKVDISHVTSKVETGLHSAKLPGPAPDLNVGDRVQVAGRRYGTIRFSGETKFAPGWWYGVELDKPRGKHNGSLHGVSYFTCPPNHGIFAVPSKLTKIAEGEDHSSDQDSADLSFSRSSTEGEMCQSMTSSMMSRKSSGGRTANRMGSGNVEGNKRCWLTVGVNVFVNNEIGVVRYVGPVDFAEGTWLGIELRSSKGRNDGTVQGRRYFTCRPNHGLLVRPSRVTVRGINGAKLMPS
ncbi:CLIP1 [Cordylochernes scorpioides]|uniref:CLIP1 n=1 Tax=Cordylochernes scorpioides TaxID=51811 RepID=A0ABY6KWK5_9ARAC|nr:CLIP1 [Cordylochernes scorpioides]